MGGRTFPEGASAPENLFTRPEDDITIILHLEGDGTGVSRGARGPDGLVSGVVKDEVTIVLHDKLVLLVGRGHDLTFQNRGLRVNAVTPVLMKMRTTWEGGGPSTPV